MSRAGIPFGIRFGGMGIRMFQLLGVNCRVLGFLGFGGFRVLQLVGSMASGFERSCHLVGALGVPKLSKGPHRQTPGFRV